MEEIENAEIKPEKWTMDSFFASLEPENLPEIELAPLELDHRFDDTPTLNSDSDCACG